MNAITAQELKSKIDNKENFQLIDVREDYEYEEANIGGINIPLDQVFSSLDKLDKNRQVIFCCNSGRKSAAIIHTIKRKLNIENVYSLKGGVSGYFETINLNEKIN